MHDVHSLFASRQAHCVWGAAEQVAKHEQSQHGGNLLILLQDRGWVCVRDRSSSGDAALDKSDLGEVRFRFSSGDEFLDLCLPRATGSTAGLVPLEVGWLD